MHTPDKIAALFLKFFVAMFLLSLITSLTNIVPYYLQMNHAANDLLLRGAVNNYILESQVNEILNKTFVENQLFNTLTYKREGASGRGVYAYARVLSTAGTAFPKGACELGTYCPSYANSSRKVIINEPAASWDPKTKTNDMIKFRDPTGAYNGAQRGESITVRLEAKVNCKVLFIGINRTFQIPLAIEKSGPAMHYFRM